MLLIPQSFIDRPLIPFRQSWRAAWGGAAVRLSLALLPRLVVWFYAGHDDECRKDGARSNVIPSPERRTRRD